MNIKMKSWIQKQQNTFWLNSLLPGFAATTTLLVWHGQELLLADSSV